MVKNMNEKTIEALSEWRGDVHIGERQNEAAELLAYRSTGMTPGDIKEVQAAVNPIPFGRFREIMEAERDGRCVVLPCKVGDTVYFLNTCWVEPICAELVTSINIDERGAYLLTENVGDPDIEPVIVSEIGAVKKNWHCDLTGVFLTREEAEAALRKQQLAGGHDE